MDDEARSTLVSRFLATEMPIFPDTDSFDRALHRRLRKIYRIKDFHREPLHNMMQILEREPFLRKMYSEEVIGKLSLLWFTVLGAYWLSAELLVRSGADVNEPYNGSNLIHVLLAYHTPNNERLIRLVADRVADFNARDRYGATALDIAVKMGQYEMIEMLLDRGADPNLPDHEGMTALLHAAKKCKGADVAVLPLLLKHGADVSARSNDGGNALHYLSEVRGFQHKRATALAGILIEKGTSIDDRMHDGLQSQPIHLAAYFGNFELVELYLDHGANINSANGAGESPLHLAVRNKKTAVVITLLKRRADVHHRNAHNQTALHVACVELQKRNLKLLLSAGADLLAEDDDGRTPFACCLQYDYEDVCSSQKLMLQALAMKKACQPTIELKDEKIIARDWDMWSYYRLCIGQVERMKVVRLGNSCTFFELLRNSPCQIAALTQNPEFVTAFKNYDLREFPKYRHAIHTAFKRAQNHDHYVLDVGTMIHPVYPWQKSPHGTHP